MFRASLAALILFLAAASAPCARAEGDFILDEYNLDTQGGSDSARVALGLSFGDGYASGWWWNAGARASWLRWQVDTPTQKGIGLGGTFGGGFRPERVVSPYAAVSLDRAFSVGGVFDWLATVHAGARVRVTPGPREHFTMTFSIYRAQAFGGNGPTGGDFGIAVLYSAALQAKKR